MKRLVLAMLIAVVLLAVNKGAAIAYDEEKARAAAEELQKDPIFKAVEAGCQKLKNPQSMLDNENIRNLNGGGSGMADFLLRAKCEGTEKMITAKYGSIYNAMNSAKLGIGVTTTYMYKNLCYSFSKLQYKIRDNPTAIVKLILMFSYPEFEKKNDPESLREFTPYVLSGTVDYLTTLTLVELEKLVYVNDIGRPEIYKRFYSALLTGDVNDALRALNRIPDKEAQKAIDFCAKVRGEKR